MAEMVLLNGEGQNVVAALDKQGDLSRQVDIKVVDDLLVGL
jgi:hypothetical protein